jgi:hypothetical protein
VPRNYWHRWCRTERWLYLKQSINICVFSFVNVLDRRAPLVTYLRDTVCTFACSADQKPENLNTSPLNSSFILRLVISVFSAHLKRSSSIPEIIAIKHDSVLVEMLFYRFGR